MTKKLRTKLSNQTTFFYIWEIPTLMHPFIQNSKIKLASFRKGYRNLKWDETQGERQFQKRIYVRQKTADTLIHYW